MAYENLSQHYENYYSAGASRWREFGAVERVDNIVRAWSLVSKSKSPRVIDIGCGEGAIAAEMKQRNFFAGYKGYEVSSSGVESSRNRDLGLEFEVFDGDRIPDKDDSYDLAVLSHVVEHLENPRMLLKEAARVSRFVFVEVPLEYHWRTKHDFKWTPVGHVNLYDPLLIRHLIQSTGFNVIKEWVANNNRATSQYRYGRYRGSVRWAFRELLINVSSNIAAKIFCLNGVLIFEKSGSSAS